MGYREAILFNHALDSAQKSAANLQAIQDARQKHQQNQELFDLKKQEAELNLDKLRLSGQQTELQNKAYKSLIDQTFKQQQDVLDGQEAQIDQAEHQETKKAQVYGQAAKTLLQNDPTVQSMVAMRVNPALAQGPNGGMVVGDSVENDTPNAIPASLFEGAQDTIKPVLNGYGKIGFKTVSAQDNAFERIKKAKAMGAELRPDEEVLYNKKMGIKGYNRNDVIKQATAMAKQSEEGLTPENIRKLIPEAEKMLYPEKFQDKKPQAQDLSVEDKLPTEDEAAKAGREASRDKYGYIEEEVKNVPGKGKFKYLGNNKWQKV